MKSHIVLIVIAATVAAGTALHAYNTSRPSELDNLGKALTGARRILQPDSRVSFKGEPSKSELLSWARYGMVPVYLDANDQYDTTLIIQYRTNGDSNLSNIVSSRKLLWQHTDSIYHYSLSTAH